MPRTAIARSELVAESTLEADLHEPETATLSLVVTDIEGSAALTERLGDQAWLELLLAHNAIVRDRVWRHGGREVKTRGDGFLLAFDRPLDAARCAISIQRALADYAERHPQAALRVRVGIHHGPALRVGDSFVGRNVNLAESIAGAAAGGEILVSSRFRDLLDGESLQFANPREMRLTGLSGTHGLHALSWQRALRSLGSS